MPFDGVRGQLDLERRPPALPTPRDHGLPVIVYRRVSADLLAFDQLKRVLRQVEASRFRRLDMARLHYWDPVWPFAAGCAIGFAMRDPWFREQGLGRTFRVGDIARVLGLSGPHAGAVVYWLFCDWHPNPSVAQVIARIDTFLAGNARLPRYEVTPDQIIVDAA